MSAVAAWVALVGNIARICAAVGLRVPEPIDLLFRQTILRSFAPAGRRSVCFVTSEKLW